MANMLYDLAGETPEPGSWLESIFSVLNKRRQEAQYLQTRVLVEAILAPHMEKSTLGETMKDYLDSMFPYLQKSKEDEEEREKKRLDRWVGQGPMSVIPPPSWDKPRGLKSRIAEARKKRSGRENVRVQRHKGVPVTSF